MKIITALLAAVVLMLSASACGAAQAPETTAPAQSITDAPMANIKNPITEYTSLEELNAICGAKLAKPGVMGVTDESFATITADDITIAEYKFSVNSQKYSMRFVNNSTADISGVYIDGQTAFSGTDGEATVKAENCMLARWFTLEGQYVLNIEGSDIDKEWFDSICEEMKNLTQSGMNNNELTELYTSLAGEWSDSVSQRAHATIVPQQESVQITVNWADSASLDNEWKMTAKRTEDGLLSYTDCEYTKIDYTDNEEGVRTVVYSDGEGFFSLSEDGTLAWTGAADENCQSCVFAK